MPVPKILMHFNAHLEHQKQHAHAFIKGCKDVIVTDMKGGEADIHIISGPHFAQEQWKGHPRVLMIDRAYWGDPDSVSIGWLQPDGTRKFASGTQHRPHPMPEPWKLREASCLVLADYGQNTAETEHHARMRFTSVNTRLHPADSTDRRVVTLQTQLRLHDVAIGHSGTSIFEAIMQGVPVICTDKNNECMPVCAPSTSSVLYRGNRTKWLHEMSYKQFTLAEIADGTAWSALENVV